MPKKVGELYQKVADVYEKPPVWPWVVGIIVVLLMLNSCS